MRSIIPGHLPFLFALIPVILAFSFTPGTVTQCDDVSVQWTGGTPPFQLHIIPNFGVPRNISIPASSFNNGQGSFSTQLQFAQGRKVVLTMSDATGFGSGGNTQILTVGASQGGSCDTSEPKLDFTYELNNALQQCGPYVFGDYSNASQPVRIMGVIPGGESFVLNPQPGPTSYTWTANIYNGTSVIFLMVDSLSHQGGSSDFYTVLSSGDTSCIDSKSPSSTATPTPTSTSMTSPSSSTSSEPSATTTAATSGSTPIAVTAATVIGSLIFLAVSITLGLFFLKKYRDRKRPWSPNGFHRDSVRIQSQANLDLAGEPSNLSSPYHYSSHTMYTSSASASANPLFSPFPQSDSQSLSLPYAPNSHSNADPFSPIDTMTEPDPFTARDSSQASMSTAQRKAAMAGATAYKPSRFILHTDMEDAAPPDVEEEVVELPPQYSERKNAPGPSTVPQQPPYNPPSL